MRTWQGHCLGAMFFGRHNPLLWDFAHTLPYASVASSIFLWVFPQPPVVLASIRRLWQKTALPTADAKFLNPRKQHLASRNARFRHEIVPSIPARHCCQCQRVVHHLPGLGPEHAVRPVQQGKVDRSLPAQPAVQDGFF